jgi:transcriptional regulator with XRE-family HTH domain
VSVNVQIINEKSRALYDKLPRPLLSQLAEIHRISVRDFASIFQISKSHAEEVLNHKTMPSLELGIRIARYFDVTTDELLAWRVDDDGSRRPLVIAIPGGGTVRLNNKNPDSDPMEVVRELARYFKEGK